MRHDPKYWDYISGLKDEFPDSVEGEKASLSGLTSS